MDDPLKALIEEAVARYEAMSPEQKRDMHRAQRASYIRAEAGFGTDAEEAEMAAALASGDADRIAQAKGREEARVALAEEYIREMGYDK
jgi:hypothetical protein